MNFYDSQEVVDNSLINIFNNRIQLLKEFKYNPLKSKIDVDAITNKNEFVQIEIKQRDCTINTYDTIFIEKGKAEYIQSRPNKAYYLNFFQTADVVAIFDLKAIDLSKIELKWVHIYDKGANTKKWVQRYLLPSYMADLYFWNEKENKYDYANAIYY